MRADYAESCAVRGARRRRHRRHRGCVAGHPLVDEERLDGRGTRRSGRQLLGTAADEAARRGLTPALDVVMSYAAAITLYERAGWRRIGTITVAMPDGARIDEYVYVAPT